uniref:Mu-like prophage DNA circulation protein n=1 Tax=Candidatus Kentrum sp. LFY TaxID=2126342 RepID=A0A450UE97_9GAMM|nr:MAG: Mu-like prophage DNA circulation protein [Candidatus Kentron sp. LFY]
MTGWLDRLERASFRDIPFLADKHDSIHGRRLVVHEYPGADVPRIEDLGTKVEEYRVVAYFIGVDYDIDRDAFLTRLSEPGAGWLIHPWLGRKWVRSRTWNVTESNGKGGFCSVDVTFVRGSEEDEPFGRVDKADTAVAGVHGLADVAVGDFSLAPVSADGMTVIEASVRNRLEELRKVVSMSALPLSWGDGVRQLIAASRSDLSALMANGSAYALAMRGIADALGSGADDSNFPDTERPRVVSRIASLVKAGNDNISGPYATDKAVLRNLSSESALRSALLIGAASRIAITEYRASTHRDQVLSSVLSAMDISMPDMSDSVFQRAANLRYGVIDALASQDLVPAKTRDVVSSLPATTLAHRLEVDEGVFLARNTVRHPLFVKGVVHG